MHPARLLPLLVTLLSTMPRASSGALPVQDTLPTAPGDSLFNPFGGFETHRLSNGVKLWYRRFPGAPDVSVSFSIPYGSDQDPEGKEESAHFTEHMLFTDHRGRTEREIKEAIDRRGGTRNGITAPDHTFYYVTIAREHGLFALEWLSRLAEPHEMPPEVVDRNRQPVAIEIRARPRELLDWLEVALNPGWIRPPRFWEREYGLEVRSERVYDRYATLYGLRPRDLRAFYDRYYVPGAMTVTVVGDLPRDTVLALSEATFGTLEPRPVPEAYGPPEDPGRFRQSISWGFRPTPRYRTVFKVFQPASRDHLYLLYARDLLRRRLGQRLRYGENKAVYGMGVGVVQRGPVMHLSMDGSVYEGELPYTRRVIAEELEALRRGSHPDEVFEEDRRALVEGLRGRNRTPEALNFQVLRRFYDPSLHRDFPDLLGFYESVSQEDLAAFVQERLVRERRHLLMRKTQPLTQGTLLALGFLVVLATVRGTGRLMTTPVEMSRIRYVARIRLSLPLLVGATLAYGAVGIAALRLLAAGLERVTLAWVVPVDSYVYQMGAYGLMGAATLAAAVLYLSLFPRKILVFDDHVRIKYLAYRSRVLREDDVDEIALAGAGRVWTSRRVLGVLPLTTGLFGPGILLVPRRGRGLYFRSRETGELHEAMAEVLAS